MGKELERFYDMVKDLEIQDIYELFINETDPGKKVFYKNLYDYVLQEKQQAIIADNTFVI
ncbi:TPA: hypothetical protein U2C93_001445 [Streptococcus suis]|uniref:hypothetical protein n=1 Tax=Streptococcus suis TaxID=1307 RepID=UPI000CF4EABE|nr:hypothetical protein [Streptococcus suis]MCB2922215.1 hypothetical protein [Streptococcus suis]MCB2932071.1 hypothetical protein [Streptococcus suis]MCB2941250.1 hypothetical protein [Streptococcus suis]MCB2941697.1 hypothetical protein [Streptococcus suis]MCB2945769.1 hypothetical protein [Streptococcus suis]